MAESLAALGCPPEKIGVHPLGVDVHSIPYAPREFRSGDTLRVLFAGAFVEKKGLRDAVQAVGLARDAGLRLELHIAGDLSGRADQWSLKDEVWALIARLGLEDCTRHHSWLGFHDLLALALRCHVFVAPSVTASDGDAEGTPFVLQQMMATAMPAVATHHSDIPYIFGEHASLLLPEHDVRGLADRLQHYHDVPETMIRDGLALRDRIRTAYDAKACAAQLSERYDRVGQTVTIPDPSRPQPVTTVRPLVGLG
jgi:colanic acid/amylovoran biosynthesis glycosyltransferase